MNLFNCNKCKKQVPRCIAGVHARWCGRKAPWITTKLVVRCHYRDERGDLRTASEGTYTILEYWGRGKNTVGKPSAEFSKAYNRAIKCMDPDHAALVGRSYDRVTIVAVTEEAGLIPGSTSPRSFTEKRRSKKKESTIWSRTLDTQRNASKDVGGNSAREVFAEWFKSESCIFSPRSGERGARKI